MADISKFTLPDGNTYYLKDETARAIANSKSAVSIDRKTSTGTNIFDITIDNTTTQIYAPSGGGGGGGAVASSYEVATSSSATSVASSTDVKLTEKTLAVGVYLITIGVNFASNTTGVRKVSFNSSTGYSNTRGQAVTQMASNNGATMVTLSMILKVDTQAAYGLNVWQNSGSSLNTTWQYKIITLSDYDTLTIPTKTSDLQNDSGYLTLGTLPIYNGSVT